MNKDNYHPIYSQNVDDNSRAKNALKKAKEIEGKAKEVHVLRRGKTIVMTSNKDRLTDFEKYLNSGLNGKV